MEYIKKELIEGEIYYVSTNNFWMIGLVTKSNNGDNSYDSFRGNATYISKDEDFNKDESWCYEAIGRTYRLASSEEKHWLNECIKLDKFITFEEAMKTFIPEYVECINPGNWKQTIKNNNDNLIFDTKIESIHISDNSWKKVIKDTTMSFKPSTKEAYDAQFVVKEPEFSNKVEQQIIELLPQFKVIKTIETITKVENNEGNQFFIGDVVKSLAGAIYTITGFEYSLNKTNILARTNNNNIIGIDKIEHYIEPKVEETLLEKAKRLYPVGTKFINPNDNRECVIKEKGNYFEGNNHNIYHSIANDVFKYEEGLSGCIYINNTWSKIIE